MTTGAVPDVRVGIVSWNTAALLDRCLASLPLALEDLHTEVVVVDNASNDESPDVAARHDHVTLVRNASNEGYARAMNTALAGSRAPVLIALNPDTLPPPGSLATLVDRLHRAPDVGLVAPRLVDKDGRDQHTAYRLPSLSLAAVVGFTPRRVLRRGLGARWWLEGYTDHSQQADVGWVIGAVHVIRTAALAGDAPYDERWFMYAEDIELCWRLARRGWRRRLEGDVAVTHIGNAAGAQAWGDRRERIHQAASLDWMARDRGAPYARAWAAITAAALGCRAAASAGDRQRARALAQAARWHAARAARGVDRPAAPRLGI